MDFNQFQSIFLSQLKSNNQECLKTIENNKILVQENLGENGKPQILNNFVNEIIEYVIDDRDGNIRIRMHSDNILQFVNKYDLIEKVLKHDSFFKVINIFCNSEVLVKACKVGNKSAVKWLLTMNINPYIQDENGVSALMYAAQHNFEFLIKLFFYDTHCINLLDKNKENVLFYCMRNSDFIKDSPLANGNKFQNDLIHNSEININQVNINGETVLTYCIKNNIIKPISKLLLHNPKIDVNIADNEGKTAAMYLTEKGLCNELLDLHRKNCFYDYIDMNGESAISILLKKLYLSNNISNTNYRNYVRIMSAFVNYQIDFNYVVDKDENTAFMVILLVNDITTAKFCAKFLKELDLSVKNIYGENATSLCYKLKQYELLPLLKDNPTFNYSYRDPLNQNTLLMIAAINNPVIMKDLLENDPSIINEVNNKNENTLIIATKINQIHAIDILLKYGININHQDNNGNTALHYAIKMREPCLIQKLMTKNPVPYLKNNEGKTAIDYVKEIEDDRDRELLLKNLKNPSMILTNPSYNLNQIKLNTPANNDFAEEIQNYLIPCANNFFSDYKSTKEKETIKKEIFGRNEVNNKKGATLTIIMIIFYILLFSMIGN